MYAPRIVTLHLMIQVINKRMRLQKFLPLGPVLVANYCWETQEQFDTKAQYPGTFMVLT